MALADDPTGAQAAHTLQLRLRPEPVPVQQPQVVDRVAYIQQQTQARRQAEAEAAQERALYEQQRTEALRSVWNPAHTTIARYQEGDPTLFGFTDENDAWRARQTPRSPEEARRAMDWADTQRQGSPLEAITKNPVLSQLGRAIPEQIRKPATRVTSEALQTAYGGGVVGRATSEVLSRTPGAEKVYGPIEDVREDVFDTMADIVIPRYVWDTALEFTGLGTVSDVRRAIAAGDTQAINAVRRAGQKLGAADNVERGLKALQSESGALRIGKTAEEKRLIEMGKAARAATGDPEVDAVLTAVTTEDIGKRNTIQKILSGTQSLREYFTPDARLNRQIDRQSIEGARNIAVRYEGRLGMADELAGLEARELRTQAGDLSREELRSITGSLDDVSPQSQATFLSKLSPKALAVQNELRTRIDQIGDLLEAKGLITAESRRGNYIPHILDFTDEGKRFVSGRPLRTPRPKTKAGIITGRRTQETLAQDIAAGYRPATLDPFKIYEEYVAEATKRMAMADVIEDLRTFDPDAVRFLKPGDSIPAGYQAVHHPIFEGAVGVTMDGEPRILRYRWIVRDNVAQYIKSLAEPSAIRQSKVGRGTLTAAASIKRTVLGAPLDVNFAGFEVKAVSYAVGSDVRKILPAGINAALRGQKAYDQFVTQTVDYFGTPMRRIDIYNRLAESGLTTGSYRTEISRMLGEDTPSTLIGLIPGPGKLYEWMQSGVEAAQFDRAIPIWKREAAIQLVQRKMRGKPMAYLATAEREAAADINRAMGGLNRVAQGRSKTMQDINALLFIAPDWMESRLRLFSSALMPGSQNATSRRFMARAMVFGAATTVAGSLAYAHERGWNQEQTARYVQQNINPIVMRDGKPHINPNFMSYQNPENGQWVSMLTWEKDGWKLLFGLGALAQGDTSAANLTIGNYFSARLGTFPRTVKEALTNRDFRGLPIRKEKGWPGLLQLMAYEASQNTMPSAFREIGAATVPGFPGGQQSPEGAALNISGLGRARPISPFDTIDRAVQDDPATSKYKRYSELPNDIKGEFDKRHPAEVAAVREYRATRGRDAFDSLRTETLTGLKELAPLRAEDPKAYRDAAGQLVRDQALATQRELQRLKDEGVDLGDREGDLGLLDRYFEATEAAENPRTHQMDFDKRDVLDEEFRAGLKPEERKRLDEMLVYSADPTYQELKIAKKQLDEGGYFDRQDDAFATFIGKIKPGSKAAEDAAQWTSLDAFEQWVKADTVKRGLAEQLYDRHPYWNAWEDIGGDLIKRFLVDDPKTDALAVEWGYRDRVSSAEAARIYESRTGKPAPIPAP